MSMGKDPTYFLVRHGIFLVAGLGAMAGAMALPVSRLDNRRVVVALVGVSLVLLLLVLAMPRPAGRIAGSGWDRWVSSPRSLRRSPPSFCWRSCCPGDRPIR